RPEENPRDQEQERDDHRWELAPGPAALGALGGDLEFELLRVTSHQRHARPTGIRNTRRANAVGHWISDLILTAPRTSSTRDSSSQAPAVSVEAGDALQGTSPIRPATAQRRTPVTRSRSATITAGSWPLARLPSAPLGV
ncbi:hypothetical protein CTI14_40835, partial [Methylobacterium radiotolerans]